MYVCVYVDVKSPAELEINSRRNQLPNRLFSQISMDHQAFDKLIRVYSNTSIEPVVRSGFIPELQDSHSLVFPRSPRRPEKYYDGA